MPFIENNKVYIVAFVIEASANLGAYFESLKKSYLVPILEYFNGAPISELDFACGEVCSRYFIVNFHGTERLLWGLVSRKGPVKKCSDLIKKFDSIDWNSGMSDNSSVINDGLAVTLDLFDEFEKQWHFQPGIIPEKHIVLVCNSPPYQIPSSRGYNYTNKMTDELIQIINEKNIRLSVVCPKKMASVYRLFELNNPDPSAFAKNFVEDSRHMVLLNGIQIQERPLSPSLREDTCNNSASRPQPVAVPTTQAKPVCISIVRPQQGMMQINDVKDVQPSQHRMVQGMSGGSIEVQPQQQQQPVVVSIHPSIAGATSVQRRQLLQPNYSTMDQQQLQQQFQLQQQQQQQQQQIVSQMQQPQIQQAQQIQQVQQMQQQQDHQQQPQATNILGVDINNPAPTLAMAAQLQQQRIIWTGILEWMDKTKTQTERKSLQCQIMINQEDSEINTSKWPEKMTMSIFPPNIIQPLQNYLKTARTVVFNFNHNQDAETLKCLFRTLSGNYSGCIHIPNVPDGPNDVRVIILLYSSRKQQYLGIIPIEQSKFLGSIKAVINRHKNATKPMTQGEMSGQPNQGVPQQNVQQPQQHQIQQYQQTMNEQRQQQYIAMQQQIQRGPINQMQQMQAQGNQPLRYLLLNRPQHMMVRQRAAVATAQGVPMPQQQQSVVIQQQGQQTNNQNFSMGEDFQGFD